jgi:hypothetical protein
MKTLVHKCPEFNGTGTVLGAVVELADVEAKMRITDYCGEETSEDVEIDGMWIMGSNPIYCRVDNSDSAIQESPCFIAKTV